MKIGFLASAVASAFLATSASAVTLDFIGFIDNVSGEFGGDVTVVDATYVPVATTATGYLGSAAGPIVDAGGFAYFDGNEAGIGVCKVLTAADQCDPPSDDNLTSGEVLGLSWGVDVILRSIGFRGELHPNDPQFDAGPLGFDLFDISYDGGTSWFTGEQLVNANFGTLYNAGDRVIPAGTSVLFAFNSEQYYVSSIVLDPVPAVPLPAGGVLMLSGLAGLAAWRRRRKS